MLKFTNNTFSAYKYLVTYDVKGESERAETFTDNIADVSLWLILIRLSIRTQYQKRLF